VSITKARRIRRHTVIFDQAIAAHTMAEDKLQGFRTLAKEAENKAKNTKDKDTRRRFQNLADGWNHLADLFKADIDKLRRKDRR
jgi:hypothetical protein